MRSKVNARAIDATLASKKPLSSSNGLKRLKKVKSVYTIQEPNQIKSKTIIIRSFKGADHAKLLLQLHTSHSILPSGGMNALDALPSILPSQHPNSGAKSKHTKMIMQLTSHHHRTANPLNHSHPYQTRLPPRSPDRSRPHHLRQKARTWPSAWPQQRASKV